MTKQNLVIGIILSISIITCIIISSYSIKLQKKTGSNKELDRISMGISVNNVYLCASIIWPAVFLAILSFLKIKFNILVVLAYFMASSYLCYKIIYLHNN